MTSWGGLCGRLGFLPSQRKNPPASSSRSLFNPSQTQTCGSSSVGANLIAGDWNRSNISPIICSHQQPLRCSSSKGSIPPPTGPRRFVAYTSFSDFEKKERVIPERFLKKPPPGESIPLLGHAEVGSEVRDEVLYEEERTKGMAQWNRWPVLNDIMGGFRKGELTILTGTTGVGKTTFLCEYAVDLQVPTLFASFEVRPSRIAKYMLCQHAQEKIPSEESGERPAWLEAQLASFEAAHSHMTWFPSEDPRLYRPSAFYPTPADRILDMIERAAWEQGVKHIIVDNLQPLHLVKKYRSLVPTSVMSSPQHLIGEVLSSMRGDTAAASQYKVQDAFVSRLRRLATAAEVHITLVVHPRKSTGGSVARTIGMDCIYGSARATQEADNVLILQKPMRDSAGSFRKFLWIAKNRYVGRVVEDNRLLLTFNPDTFSTNMELLAAAPNMHRTRSQ